MASAQQNRGARVIAFSGINVTPIPTPTLLHERRRLFNGRTQRYVCVCFDGRPVIFNTHNTILLTKSISFLSNLKSNN